MRLSRVLAFLLFLLPLASFRPLRRIRSAILLSTIWRKISSDRGTLHVRYILDIADIPSFQIMHAQSGDWTQAEMQQWAQNEIAVVRSGLRVSIDGAPQTLESHSARASLRPGAGGLPIIRWVGEFTMPVTAGAAHSVSVQDSVYPTAASGGKILSLVRRRSRRTNCAATPAR